MNITQDLWQGIPTNVFESSGGQELQRRIKELVKIKKMLLKNVKLKISFSFFGFYGKINQLRYHRDNS